MSGRGETPEEAEEPDPDATRVAVGQTLYTDDGDPVGSVRGVEEGGVFLATRDGVERLTIEHARSGHAWGAAELVWRCLECGAMGHIDGDVPDGCPDCDVPRENLMYWTED